MRKSAVGLLMAFAVATLSAAGAVEGNPVLSKGQVKEMARTAHTPEQHWQLAEYYRAESRTLMAESKNYSALADQYDRNPASHPIPKFPTFGQHCRQVAAQDLKDAQKADGLAQMHEQLAGSGIASK
jgi:hypothetical protein